jgi:septal ring factor EnvC (AmiA/AmiB activator)
MSHGFVKTSACVLLATALLGVASGLHAEEVIEVIIKLNSDLQAERQETGKIESQIKSVEQNLAPREKEKKIWDDQVKILKPDLDRMRPRLESFAAEEKALNVRIDQWNSKCAGTRPRAVWEACQAPGRKLDQDKADLQRREAPVLAEFNQKVKRLESIVQRQAQVNKEYSDLRLQADGLRKSLQERNARIEQITSRLKSGCAGLKYDEQVAHCAGIDWDGTRRDLPAGHMLRPGGSEFFGIRGAGETWRDTGKPITGGSVIGVPVEEFKPKPRLGPSVPPPPPP